MDLDLTVVLLAGAVALLGAAVQGAVGLGLGLVASPVWALLEPSLVPATILLTTSVLPVLTSLRELDGVDWRGLSFALPARVVGTAAGAWIVVTQPATTVAVVVAVVVLGAVALALTRWQASPTPRALVAAGLVSGVSGTATSVGGPPVALLYARSPGQVLRSTMGVYFLVGNLVSLAVLSLAGAVGTRDLARASVLVPFVVAGFLLSGPLRRHVEGRVLRAAVLLLSAGSAVVLLAVTLLDRV